MTINAAAALGARSPLYRLADDPMPHAALAELSAIQTASFADAAVIRSSRAHFRCQLTQFMTGQIVAQVVHILDAAPPTRQR
jgi:hypothetical protein